MQPCLCLLPDFPIVFFGGGGGGDFVCLFNCCFILFCFGGFCLFVCFTEFVQPGREPNLKNNQLASVA